MDGAFTGSAGFGFGGAVAVGSVFAQASLEPHASILLRPEVLFTCAANFGAG